MSSDDRTTDAMIDATVGLLIDTIVRIGTAAKRELHRSADLERIVQDLAEQLAVAGQRLSQKALAISRLEATWRESEFARHVQADRADRHCMELTRIDSALDDAERVFGVGDQGSSDADRVTRVRALADQMADRHRATGPSEAGRSKPTTDSAGTSDKQTCGDP